MKKKKITIGTIVTIVSLIIAVMSYWAINRQHSENRDDRMKGEWEMEVKIKSASFDKFIGSEIKWKLIIIQKGMNISGKGTKIEVNNERLDFNERTHIEMEGTIKGNDFSIKYTEEGKERDTDGLFIGVLEGDEFKGEFSQGASDTKGTIKGKRVN